jgi:hypothetical protein
MCAATRVLLALVTAGAAITVAAVAVPAAAGTISTPGANPFLVPLNSGGTGPAPFTIQGRGFPAGSTVYAIICDGTRTTTPNWDPTVYCDNVTSPAGISVPPSGIVTFDATNKNFQIGVFDGLSPSQKFNCLYPGQPDPKNSYPSWGSNTALPNGGGAAGCQLRVATNNAAVTSDQAFITLILPRPKCATSCLPASPANSTPTAAPTASSAAPSAASTASPAPSASASPGSSGDPVAVASSGASGGATPSQLAMTGDDVRRDFTFGVCLVVAGLVVLGLTWRRRSAGGASIT